MTNVVELWPTSRPLSVEDGELLLTIRRIVAAGSLPALFGSGTSLALQAAGRAVVDDMLQDGSQAEMDEENRRRLQTAVRGMREAADTLLEALVAAAPATGASLPPQSLLCR